MMNKMTWNYSGMVSHFNINNVTKPKFTNVVEEVLDPSKSSMVVVLFSICITGLGALANCIVIAKIVCDKTLHKPPQVAMCFLILSYTLALLTSFWHFNLEYVVLVAKLRIVNYLPLALLINKEIFVHSAAVHAAYMSVIKYRLSVSPLQALSTYSVVKTSLCLWTFSTIYGVFAIGLPRLFNKYGKFDVEVIHWLVIVSKLYIIVVPLGVMLIFQCLKFKRSRLPVLSEEQTYEEHDHAVRTCNIICIILIIYILASTPYLKITIAQEITLIMKRNEAIQIPSYHIPGAAKTDVFTYMVPAAQLFWLANYASIAFVYYMIFVCKCRADICDCTGDDQNDIPIEHSTQRDYNPENVMQESVV